jgi:hypothetical protein
LLATEAAGCAWRSGATSRFAGAELISGPGATPSNFHRFSAENSRANLHQNGVCKNGREFALGHGRFTSAVRAYDRASAFGFCTGVCANSMNYYVTPRLAVLTRLPNWHFLHLLPVLFPFFSPTALLEIDSISITPTREILA